MKIVKTMFEDTNFKNIPKEQKLKIERKLQEFEIRMKGKLSNKNKRLYILFALGKNNKPPAFLRKLRKNENRTFNNNDQKSSLKNCISSSENMSVNNYKVVFNEDINKIKGILKNSTTNLNNKNKKENNNSNKNKRVSFVI